MHRSSLVPPYLSSSVAIPSGLTTRPFLNLAVAWVTSSIGIGCARGPIAPYVVERAGRGREKKALKVLRYYCYCFFWFSDYGAFVVFDHQLVRLVLGQVLLPL